MRLSSGRIGHYGGSFQVRLFASAQARRTDDIFPLPAIGATETGKHGAAIHRLTPEEASHPVVAGLEDGFEITDELYLRMPLAESQDIVPLLRSNFCFTQENFNPLPLGITGPEEWVHPEGDNVVVWAKRTGNSPVVACEAGDCPAAYGHPSFRRLLVNALSWVASEEARAWARRRPPNLS
jgi:type 1 glutamine amidotransferase